MRKLHEFTTSFHGLAFVLSTLIVLPLAIPETTAQQLPPKGKKRRIDYSEQNWTKTSHPAPPNPEVMPSGGVMYCGTSTTDVWLFADPRNNAKTAPEKVKYYYTGCLHWLENQEGRPEMQLKAWEGDPWAVVTMYLVRETPDLIEDMRTRVNYLEQSDVAAAQLIPTPMLMVEIWPQHEWLFPYEIYVKYPIESDPESSGILSSPVQPVDFVIPVDSLDEFRGRVLDGLTFWIRFVYASSVQGIDRFDAATKVSISSKMKQDFFGNRTTVFATQEQIYSLFSSALVESAITATTSQPQMLQNYFNAAQAIINGSLATAKELGDITRQEFTKYAMNPDSPLMTPDFTAKTKDSIASATRQIDAYRELQQRYSKTQGGGGFSFFGIGAKADGSKEKSSTDETQTLRDYLQELGELHEWDGKETKPLRQKIYAVSQGDLSFETLSTLQVTTLQGAGVSVVGMLRDTVRDTLPFDAQKLREIQRRFPEVKKPGTRGAPVAGRKRRGS